MDFFGDGGLHDNAASGTSHRHGLGEAGGGAGGVDGDVEETGAGALHAEAFGDGDLFRMAAEEMDLGTADLEDLSDEEAEFAIAEDGDSFAFQLAELLLDFAGGGDGFSEDGFFVREGGRDGEEVRFGEGEIFGEGARVLDDAEDGAGGAVAAEALRASRAVAAGKVDFADDAAADPGGGVGLLDDADELVAGATGEAVVAAEEFEIGVADAGEDDADQGMAFGAAGLFDVDTAFGQADG